MLHTETVLESTLDLLKAVQRLSGVSGMRLVGGTALALHFGHRKSIDLDLFGTFDETVSFRRLLANAGYVANGAENGAVQSLNVNNVKVDFVNYPYPWLENPVVRDGMVLAGVQDIAAMKLSAAANRGKKKDFIDIAFLLERYSLDKMFDLYKRKFSVTEFSFALRGLTYFDDAEDDPMPEMLIPTTWDAVKCKIETSVREFVNGLG